MSRDITQLHPTLQTKIAELKKICEQHGLKLGIGECFRTVAEQDALYAQGRTKPGKVVTNAKGSSYSSQHQWGIAFDFFKNIKGQEYSDAAFFEKVASIAKGLGLGWGGDWTSFKDRPHLYLPEWGSTTVELKKKYGTPDKFKKTWKKKATLETANDKLQQALGIKEGNATLTDANNELKDALGIKKTETPKPTTVNEGVTYKMNTLKKGSTGNDVTIFESIMKKMGYYTGKIDTEYGNGCVAACNAFQTKYPECGTNGKPDGSFGPKCWAKALSLLKA